MRSEQRTSLESAWARLLSAPPSAESRMRVHELECETSWGNVALGIDADDTRHLLVPILSSSRVRSGLDGPGLALDKRVLEDDGAPTTFADLSCGKSELYYLFDDLCSEVVVELENYAQRPLRSLYQVIERWRSLFARSTSPLSDEAAVGLYGELLVLRRLLHDDASAHRSWVGPQGAHHDFVLDGLDIEVKATGSTEDHTVRIHGLDQLKEPEVGNLLLAWFRLADSRLPGTGTPLLSLVEEILSLADDELAVRALLERVGYLPGTVGANDTRRYTVADERWYLVDDAFPRILRASLEAGSVPATVSNVHYTVDLTGDSPAPISTGTAHQMLQSKSNLER